jgi:hypothetical protein
MGKIRFQVVRNSLVISRACGATRNRGNTAATAKLAAPIAPGSGKSQSASRSVLEYLGLGRMTRRSDLAARLRADGFYFLPREILFSRVNHGHQLEVSPAFEQLISNDTRH